MRVTPEEVAHLASLARLRLDEAETRAMAEQLGSILEHLDALGDADATAADGSSLLAGRAAPLRSDDVGPDALDRPLSDLAPRWEAPFVVVPRVAALDADVAEAVAAAKEE